LFLGSQAPAQITPNFPAGSQADISYLSENYLEPFAGFLQSGLANGWYQTAKPHKSLRFDFTFTPSYIVIPTAQQSFLIENSALDELQLADGSSSAETPTVFGDQSPGPELELKNDPLNLSDFAMPQGLSSTFTLIPAYKAAVGIYKGTELSLRYVPEVGLPLVDGSQFDLWGFGVKHDIKQWIPGVKKLPLSISGFFGYTNLSFSQDLEIGSGNTDNQQLLIESNSITTRLLISKKFLFITPYVGVGFNSGSTTIDLKGDYTVFINEPLTGATLDETTYTDPVSIESELANGFVANVGVRFILIKFLALSADYTIGEYHAFTTGFGFNFDI